MERTTAWGTKNCDRAKLSSFLVRLAHVIVWLRRPVTAVAVPKIGVERLFKFCFHAASWPRDLRLITWLAKRLVPEF